VLVGAARRGRAASGRPGFAFRPVFQRFRPCLFGFGRAFEPVFRGFWGGRGGAPVPSGGGRVAMLVLTHIDRVDFRVCGLSGADPHLAPQPESLRPAWPPAASGRGFLCPRVCPRHPRHLHSRAIRVFRVLSRVFPSTTGGRAGFASLDGWRGCVLLRWAGQSTLNQRVQGSSPCRGSLRWDMYLGVVWRAGLFGVSTPDATPAAGTGLLPSHL
jgi:hypothetical protein